MRHKISFLQSHPIQYHSPLYDQLEQHASVDFKIYYCSDYGLSKDGKRFHPEFGELPNWDTDLVSGHTYEVLKNHAFKKGIFNGFFGLMNFGVYTTLKRDNPDVLVINGWNYFTMIWAVFCCKLLGIKIYVRGDNSLEGDRLLSKWKLKLKHFFYGTLLFPMYDKIGYVGEMNKKFFKSYGISDRQLLHLPHAVDNSTFREFFEQNQSNQRIIRDRLEIPHHFNVLFIGRLHSEKRILDLIHAVGAIQGPVHLTIVGDGKGKDEIEHLISSYDHTKFKLAGFKNQHELLNYYMTGDVMVLPSQLETWGLVINEAMNFNLPLILSDKVGCAEDLCLERNGFIYNMGAVNDLRMHIEFLAKNPNIAKKMGVESGNIIKQYSYQSIITNLIQSL